MGMIDDVVNLVKQGPRVASEIDKVKFNTKSVARGANDATFQFPCLISNTISIDMASIIAKTMEKTYVVFTQSWLSLNPTIDITMDRNILQYFTEFFFFFLIYAHSCGRFMTSINELKFRLNFFNGLEYFYE